MAKKRPKSKSQGHITREINQAKSDSNYPGGAYKRRDDILRELGFSSYSEYLNSELWKGIRVKVYTRNGSKCYLCPQKSTELHHNSYCKPVMEGLVVDFIYPICHECHAMIEFRDGRKQSLCRVVGSFWSLYLSRLPSKPEIKKPKKSRDRPEKGRNYFCPCGQRRKHNRPLCGKCGGKISWKHPKHDEINKPKSHHIHRANQTRPRPMTELERIISWANHANDWKKRNQLQENP